MSVSMFAPCLTDLLTVWETFGETRLVHQSMNRQRHGIIVGDSSGSFIAIMEKKSY